MEPTETPKAVSDYMANIGRKGGSVSSEAKTAAARIAAKKSADARRKRKELANLLFEQLVEEEAKAGHNG